MSTFEERRLRRKKNMTLKKVSLHSDEHHSFHLGLDVVPAWNLLFNMSIKTWEEKTGKKASTFVDKTKVRIINLKDK